MTHLPHDYCRCAGVNCARKTECLRVVEMENMGPRSPWTERFCPVGRESEGVIAMRKDAPQ